MARSLDLRQPIQNNGAEAIKKPPAINFLRCDHRKLESSSRWWSGWITTSSGGWARPCASYISHRRCGSAWTFASQKRCAASRHLKTMHAISAGSAYGRPSGVTEAEVIRSFRKTAHSVERIRSVQSRGLRRGSKSRISVPPSKSHGSAEIRALLWEWLLAVGLQIAAPPDTKMVSPVIQRASSEARKETGGAISSGCPARPSGVVATAPFSKSLPTIPAE